MFFSSNTSHFALRSGGSQVTQICCWITRLSFSSPAAGNLSNVSPNHFSSNCPSSNGSHQLPHRKNFWKLKYVLKGHAKSLEEIKLAVCCSKIYNYLEHDACKEHFSKLWSVRLSWQHWQMWHMKIVLVVMAPTSLIVSDKSCLDCDWCNYKHTLTSSWCWGGKWHEQTSIGVIKRVHIIFQGSSIFVRPDRVLILVENCIIPI